MHCGGAGICQGMDGFMAFHDDVMMCVSVGVCLGGSSRATRTPHFLKKNDHEVGHGPLSCYF